MIRNINFFILCASMLFCWQIAGAQNVIIQVIPANMPIEIPEQGGTFTYQLQITNNGTSPQHCTVWCIATTPTGDHRIVLPPWTFGLGGWQTIQQNFTQTVPAISPIGNYVFTAKVGVYPDTVWNIDQFTFVKLKPPEWVARYDGLGADEDIAYDMTMDQDGNVYVTGTSIGLASGADYATIKYNSSGVQQWVARYDGPANSEDQALGIALDQDGNVYVTGVSTGLRTGYDYATIKYNANGVEQWVARYNRAGNNWDRAYSLVVDEHRNVYVTGESSNTGSEYDYLTIKYDTDGVQLWVVRYDGPENGLDSAQDLVVDSDDNVYVIGQSEGIGTQSDFATVKYNSSGLQQWVARYNGPDDSHDYGIKIALDPNDNIYVTGPSFGIGMDYDYMTIKYSPAGQQMWCRRYNGLGNYYDAPSDLVVDQGGNVIVTGTSAALLIDDWDYTTVKYSTSGLQQWVSRYEGYAMSVDYANRLALDQAGNVYVTGSSIGSTNMWDYLTVKYNRSGAQQWVARYNGPGNFLDEAHGLAVDSDGNVYITGESYGDQDNGDFTTIKYSSTDLPDWQQPVATFFGAPAPADYRLDPCYPNPFNPTTTISYTLSVASLVSLTIYDVSGKKVTELVNGRRDAGVQQVTFDGSALAAGVYFCRLQAGDYTNVQKMALVK